jgi:hypothetical protein
VGYADHQRPRCGTSSLTPRGVRGDVDVVGTNLDDQAVADLVGLRGIRALQSEMRVRWPPESELPRARTARSSAPSEAAFRPSSPAYSTCAPVVGVRLRSLVCRSGRQARPSSEYCRRRWPPRSPGSPARKLTPRPYSRARPARAPAWGSSSRKQSCSCLPPPCALAPARRSSAQAVCGPDRYRGLPWSQDRAARPHSHPPGRQRESPVAAGKRWFERSAAGRSSPSSHGDRAGSPCTRPHKRARLTGRTTGCYARRCWYA